MKKYPVVLSGIITAFGVIVMFMTNVFPIADYTMPAIAGILLVVIVIEYNINWALLSFLSVSILSLIMISSKFSVVLYICFFGIYPILKSVIEKKCNKTLQRILKFILVNISILTAGFISIFVFKLEDIISSIGELKTPLFLGLILIFNFIFILFDIALTKLIYIYNFNIRKKFFKT